MRIRAEQREAIPMEIGEEHVVPWHAATRIHAIWSARYTGARFALFERDGDRILKRIELNDSSDYGRITGGKHARTSMQPGDSIPGTGRQTWPLVAKWNRRYAPSRYEARRDPNTKEVLIWRTR